MERRVSTKLLMCTFGYRYFLKYRLIGHARVQVESLAQGPPPPMPASIGLGPLPTANAGLAERNLSLATVVLGLI